MRQGRDSSFANKPPGRETDRAGTLLLRLDDSLRIRGFRDTLNNPSLVPVSGDFFCEMLDQSERLPVEEALRRALRNDKTLVLTPSFAGGHAELRFFEVTVFPCLMQEPSHAGLSLLVRDITHRRRRDQIHHARYRISRAALNLEVRPLLTRVLDEAEAITHSTIGFFHFVDSDQEHLYLQAWSTHTTENTGSAIGAGSHNDLGQAGVWADCVRERRPIIQNDNHSLSDRKGMPEGHAEIRREAVVPLLREDKVVAVMGVGNKPTPYDDEDLTWLTELVDLAWETVVRKRAETRLVETEHRLTQALAHLPGMVFRFNLNYSLLFASRGCLDLTGYRSEELVEDRVISYGSLIHPEDRHKLEAAIHEAAERDATHQVVYRLQTRQEKTKWVWQQGRSVQRQGRMVAVEGFAHDITSQIEAQRQRQEIERKALAAQKMESLGVLAGGIAHDFNNLLQVLVGNLEVGLDMLPAEHPARECLDEVGKAAMRAAGLTRQMLDFSGKGRMSAKVLDLNSRIEVMWNLLESAAPVSVRVEAHLGAELPRIKVDPAQLQQVVLNLVTNAAEAVDEKGGRVILRTGRMDCDGTLLAEASMSTEAEDPGPEPGEYVFIEVEDDGCGMSEEARHRICEPFYTTKFTGRGLGMAAVQGILRGHGGWLLVESTPGQGSRLRVGFPVARTPVGTERGKAKEGSPGRGPAPGRILVVDDEKHVRDLVRLTLRNRGLAVDCAQDGREAVEFFEANPLGYSCVLLDLLMPFMGGRECLDIMRAINADQKVILMSGFSEQNIREQFDAGEVQGVLTKPFPRREVLAMLAPFVGPLS